ncbi:hypothetical protein [Dyadobacter arcticus]|uniref:FkbH-like protein n=1 Tax=Dyadobacter arcticus TaxID=1078754 RepID=A0ABX0UH29_9BACT|nr:hypothetical protein [Dyadobacter arcticus]NIJ52322.1 FkbH-like protein [Dyadobacter arcticus]
MISPAQNVFIFTNFQASSFKTAVQWLIDSSYIGAGPVDDVYCRSFFEMSYFNIVDDSHVCILIDWSSFDSLRECEIECGAIAAFAENLKAEVNYASFSIYSFPVPEENTETILLKNSVETMLMLSWIRYKAIDQISGYCSVNNKFLLGLHALGCPFSPELLALASLDFVRYIWHQQKSPYKLIITDCDDTLWMGNAIEGDVLCTTDSSRRILQYLKRRQSDGVILSICTKSRKSDVVESFSTLKLPVDFDDFLASSFNVVSKPEAIQNQATRLAIDLGNVMVIDNDIRECYDIQQNLPQVTCICIPEDSSKVLDLLETDWVWGFDNSHSSYNDSYQRSLNHSEQISRNAFIEMHPKEDLHKILGLKWNVSKLELEDIPRVVELSHRARQWNNGFSSITDDFVLRWIQQENNAVRVLTATDKFGDYGLVGYIFYSIKDHYFIVEKMAMSCRMLYKGLEHVFLSHVIEDEGELDFRQIVVRFKPTERNTKMGAWLTNTFELIDAVDFRCSKELFKPMDIRNFELRTINDLETSLDSDRKGKMHRVDGTNFGRIDNKALWVARQLSDLSSFDKVYKSSLRMASIFAESNIPVSWSKLEKIVFNLWVTNGGPNTIQPDSDLFNEVRDSLFAMAFISIIEDEFKISIPAYSVFESTFSITEIAVLIECLTLLQIPLEELNDTISTL